SKVGNWGGSAAIRLPKSAVEALGLEEGEQVEITIDKDALVVTRRAPKYALSQLLEEARACERPAIEDDEPVGEEWPKH
ncbi:MAG: AbrB/MazE/SpoVT family DNA-binding domain-containing protein, partial [Pseudomonadota bacterium]